MARYLANTNTFDLRLLDRSAGQAGDRFKNKATTFRVMTWRLGVSTIFWLGSFLWFLMLAQHFLELFRKYSESFSLRVVYFRRSWAGDRVASRTTSLSGRFFLLCVLIEDSSKFLF